LQTSIKPVSNRFFNKKTAVTAVVFLYWMGLYLYGSTLSVYVQSKVGDLAIVGSILAMYGLWQGIVRLPIGITADWVGRRKPDVIIGLIIVAVGAYGLGQAQEAGGLAFMRALVGIGAGTWVPLLVLFNSLYPPEQAFRATGLITLIGTLARMLSTGINGPLNSLTGGYEAAFDLAAAAAVIAVLLMLFVREERQEPKPPQLRRLLKLFMRPDVLGPALLNLALHYGDWSATFSFLPILAKNFGASDVAISTLVSANLGVVALGNFLVTWLGPRLRYKTMLVISFVLVGAGLGLAAIAPSLGFVIAAQLVIGSGFGIAYPVLLGACIRHVDNGERTSAMGLNQTVYAIGMFAGPWMSGILSNAMGIQPMFAITAVVVAVSGLAGSIFLRER
jgi:MFS transporter, DHA1 family, multidrug resistance protein